MMTSKRAQRLVTRAIMVGLTAAVTTMLSCHERKVTPTDITATPTEESPSDSTIYGRCGINTATHTLEIVTDDGDTISCVIHHADTADMDDPVKGGLFVGDRLAVLLDTGGDDELVATRVINLTTLMGRWASLDRTFELHEGGVVTSCSSEPEPWTEWRITNGRLVLSVDTFDIFTLGADSLWLENAGGIYEYRRMGSEP